MNQFEVFGCYAGEKLIAVFRNKIDAEDYAINNALTIRSILDTDTIKWLVL